MRVQRAIPPVVLGVGEQIKIFLFTVGIKINMFQIDKHNQVTNINHTDFLFRTFNTTKENMQSGDIIVTTDKKDKKTNAATAKLNLQRR